METYKIGNKVTAIIRAYSAGKIGDDVMTYDNQPYTLLHGVSADLRFTDVSKTAKDAVSTVLYHNMNVLDSITISNVELTNKIMNLIFPKSESKLAHVAENYDSDENGCIYLNHTGTLYQIFVYDSDGNLEQESCLGVYNTESEDGAQPLFVLKPNSNYLVIYSYEKEIAYNLNNYNNIYLTVDLQITGNADDERATMWIHLDKCGIHVDKDMYFSQNSNAADLIFEIISDGTTENYITVK